MGTKRDYDEYRVTLFEEPLLPRPKCSARDPISNEQITVWAVDRSHHYTAECPMSPEWRLARQTNDPYHTVMIQVVEAPKEDLRLVRSVHHPHVVPIEEVYWHEGRASIVYRYTVGSLADLLTFRPHLGLSETADLCQGVLSGLAYIHNVLGIVHGSLTLADIRLELDGTVKIGELPPETL